jgi:membrane peptidoglycan carboxypeptidase
MNLGRPAAGKTGTSQNAYSAWFAGYTPNLATAVSIFREDEAGNPIEIGPYGGRGEITGGSYPTMVWTDYMSGALEAMDLPVEEFPERGELPQVEKPDNDSGVPNQAPAPAPPRAPAPDNGGGGGGGGSGSDDQEEPREPEEPEAPEEDEGGEEPAPPEEDEGNDDDGGEGIEPPENPPEADPPNPGPPEDPEPAPDSTN